MIIKYFIKPTKIFLIIFFLKSCTTFEDISKGLDKYYGLSINSLIQTIGYPNGERIVAGRKLYVWDSRRTVTYSMPTTTQSSGTVYSGMSSGTYYGSSTTWVPTTANYFCTITVEVDSSDKIINSQFNGNIGGCERYAAAFRR